MTHLRNLSDAELARWLRDQPGTKFAIINEQARSGSIVSLSASGASDIVALAEEFERRASDNRHPLSLIQAVEQLRSWCIPGMDWTDDTGKALLEELDAAIVNARRTNIPALTASLTADQRPTEEMFE